MKRHREEPREIDIITDEELDFSILDDINVMALDEPEADQPAEAIVRIEPQLVSAVGADQWPSEARSHRRDVYINPCRALSWPTRAQALLWLPFGVVVLLGAVLRFWGLGDKPLHHDESLHAFYSLQLMHDMENWTACFQGLRDCYRYDPLLHGPFQFHAIALVYQISQWLQAPDHGINTTTVRILAATLGSALVGLPYLLRNRLGTLGAWLACLLLAVSPGMVYFSRFAREDIYMAFFTLLLVVCTAHYLSRRKPGWLLGAAVALALSYATKEATFLTIGIFGSFLGALLVWELGLKWRLFAVQVVGKSGVLYTSALFAVFIYWLLLVPFALIFLVILKALSFYIADPKHIDAANAFVNKLELVTIVLIPLLGVFLGCYLIFRVMHDARGTSEDRRSLARKVDPAIQPLLDTIVTMPWTHWFFALLAGWAVFLLLFSVLLSNVPYGLVDGIWQGLYYWIQQIAVQRGDQPWYYYLLLVPLYEQVGVVFGLFGIVRCLLHPTRFRLFLVYWFVGNLFIYSWAAEKMPWMMIHLTMPMLLLAALGLEPAARQLVRVIQNWWVASARGNVVRPAHLVGAALTVALACILLVPTLQNMYQVTYVYPADGPHEMMIYVQTTVDIDKVMAKVDELDQKLYHGSHQLSIGLTEHGEWPMLWYLRDYPKICHPFSSSCSSDVQVIITGAEDTVGIITQYASSVQGKPPAFQLYKEYDMRSWWDEGYKPPPSCAPTPEDACVGKQTIGGVGLGLWLSYGDHPPKNAQFAPSRAANNIWQWWWQRKAIGSTSGAYTMGLFVHTGLGVTP